MEKHYSRLNESERVTIMVMRLKGSSMSEIAKALGRHKSTISRELRVDP